MLQNMHIFKEKQYILFNLPENVTKLNVFFETCVFKSTCSTSTV